MRLLNVLAVLAPLLPVCNANFDLYMTVFDDAIVDWSVFQNDPDKWTALESSPFPRKNDVSGGKIGIRCVGWCNEEDRPGGIEVLEMHFRNNPLLHWSKYIKFIFGSKQRYRRLTRFVVPQLSTRIVITK
jgi:hypothetical protein